MNFIVEMIAYIRCLRKHFWKVTGYLPIFIEKVLAYRVYKLFYDYENAVDNRENAYNDEYPIGKNPFCYDEEDTEEDYEQGFDDCKPSVKGLKGLGFACRYDEEIDAVNDKYDAEHEKGDFEDRPTANDDCDT